MKTLAEQLVACAELGKAITGTLHREKILEVILSRLSELVAAQNWTLYLVDEQRRELRFELVTGLNAAAVARTRIKIGEGIAGTAAATGEIIVVPDAARDARVNRNVDRSTGFVTRSLITLPLTRGANVIGVLQVVNPEDASLFEPERLPVLRLISDFMAIAITNASNHERMRTLSLTDDLSGFSNTRFLHQRLGELIDLGTPTSLVFLDMDEFKKIVDAFGHPSGSKVLKEVAGVIGAQLDAGDSLVRYGGDEYVILLPEQGKQAALQKVETIRRALASTSFLVEEGHNIPVTASFGIAHYPEDASDVKELLRSADLALYCSKGRGKNRISVYGDAGAR